MNQVITSWIICQCEAKEEMELKDDDDDDDHEDDDNHNDVYTFVSFFV